MKAVVIGAEGMMGRWLVNHLARLGYEVHPVDPRLGEEAQVMEAADLVFVSVPIPETPRAVSQAARHMKPGATLAEIASLKEGVVEPLRAAANRGVAPLCVHPMFGPSTNRLDNKVVAVIPLLDVSRERGLAESLFPGAEVVALDAEAHDEYMAAVLSLPYLVNLAFAVALSGRDLNAVRRLGGTTFTLQYTLAQSVVAEKTELVEALLSQNRHLDHMRKAFLEAMDRLTESVKAGEFPRHHGWIRGLLESDPSFAQAADSRQRAYDAVKDHDVKYGSGQG